MSRRARNRLSSGGGEGAGIMAEIGGARSNFVLPAGGMRVLRNPFSEVSTGDSASKPKLPDPGVVENIIVDGSLTSSRHLTTPDSGYLESI